MPPEKVRGPVGNLWRDVLVLFLAIPDPRVPLYVKGGVLLGIAYLLSPVDLLPEFVPLAGFIDDLIIVPLIMRFTFRLIPQYIVGELRAKSDTIHGLGKKVLIIAALVFFGWLALIVGISAYVLTKVF